MNATHEIDKTTILAAASRACDALITQHETLLSLDQAMGDGDLGITVLKMGTALKKYIQDTAQDDLGKLLIGLGMETNRAAPSTMGTLLATALMRMGREVMGKASLTTADLAQMLITAGNSIRERGKASLGDKTVLDVIVPAGEAFQEGIARGDSLAEAARRMVSAAESGRDKVTPSQSRIGRASWVGERTAGLVDPGCEAMVIILKAIANP